MSDERYNGWANRETWAFNLHWNNDPGLYRETLAVAETTVEDNPEITDSGLGEFVVTYWQDMCFDWGEQMGGELPEGLAMFRDEVGSWWRIDYAEVGAAVRRFLDNEA